MFYPNSFFTIRPNNVSFLHSGWDGFFTTTSSFLTGSAFSAATESESCCVSGSSNTGSGVVSTKVSVVTSF